MITFSMWEFKNLENIEQVKRLIINNQLQKEEVDWDDEPLISRFEEVDGFSLSNIETIEIDDNEIKYIFFKADIERPKLERNWYDEKGNLKPRDERINKYECEIIIFELNNNINAIFLTGVWSARQRIINFIFKDDEWGNIEQVNRDINEDFLFWIFKELMNCSSLVPLSDSIQIYLTGLVSYMGKTNDDENTVTGKGARVSAMLGTLAFLFNNDNLKKVRPELQYNGHSFLIEIPLNGTFKISEEEYQGEFNDFEEHIKIVAILIYVHSILLPKLIRCYIEKKEKDEWSARHKLNFLMQLGEQIKQRVNNELEIIEKQEI